MSTTNEAAQLRKELEEFRQLHQQAVLDAQQATELATKIASRGRDEKSPRSTDPGTTSKRPG